MVVFMTNLSEIQDDLTGITDIDLLQFQLLQQREKLLSMINLLIQTEFSYGDLIFRMDYQRLSDDYHRLTNENNLLNKEYQHLGHACLYLINKTHDLIDERTRYYHQWEQHRTSLTPRPDWDKVSNVIDGRMERWKQLAIGKSSGQLMEILLREIINGNHRESTEEEAYFLALGDDSTVLPFLRSPKYHRIINRKMRRRRTGLLIKEIWSGRMDDVQEHLSVRVKNYLEKYCHSTDMAIELGYNLRDACERYHHSEQINLFWGILTGQIEEYVYHYQMQCIAQLLEHFIGIHADISHLVFTMDQFIQALKIFYPRKTPSQIEQLILAAQHDSSHSTDQSLEVDSLFIEDDEGRYGEFLSILIQQIHADKISYIEQIKQLLLGYPLITVSQFSRVISMIDPKISSEELHRYIQWVFSLKIYPCSTQMIPSMDLEDLLRRLENCACFEH